MVVVVLLALTDKEDDVRLTHFSVFWDFLWGVWGAVLYVLAAE